MSKLTKLPFATSLSIGISEFSNCQDIFRNDGFVNKNVKRSLVACARVTDGKDGCSSLFNHIDRKSMMIIDFVVDI